MVSDPAWPWSALEFMTHPSWQGKAVTTADTIVSFSSSPAHRGFCLPSFCSLSRLFTKNLSLPFFFSFFFLAHKSHFFLLALMFYLLYSNLSRCIIPNYKLFKVIFLKTSIIREFTVVVLKTPIELEELKSLVQLGKDSHWNKIGIHKIKYLLWHFLN